MKIFFANSMMEDVLRMDSSGQQRLSRFVSMLQDNTSDFALLQKRSQVLDVPAGRLFMTSLGQYRMVWTYQESAEGDDQRTIVALAIIKREEDSDHWANAVANLATRRLLEITRPRDN